MSLASVKYNYMKFNNNGGRSNGTPTMYQQNGTREPINGSFFSQSYFSRLTICPGIRVVLVPKEYDSIPFTILAGFSCGFQTGAGATTDVIDPRESKTPHLAAFGAGAVDFSALFATKAICPPETQIIAVDLTKSRLALARE
jgi:aryl-alcohol dehydrogenase